MGVRVSLGAQKKKLDLWRRWLSRVCLKSTKHPFDSDRIHRKFLCEVKNSYTYKKQEMKDKFETYSKLGYKPKLLLGNQFVTL